jgi:hypothetical protein
MSIAPEPILRAANETVAFACAFCRNVTLSQDIPIRMINEMMEAIHEVPRMVTDWAHHDLQALRVHLGCFTASRWPGAPDLVTFFDDALSRYGGP